MNSPELNLEDNLSKLCIPMGTAVSAKFRGAFCEALVNNVDKIILCRIQLVDNKKTIKVKAEDIIGNISTNSKVQIKMPQGLMNGIILKIIDNSIYHVVFNDGDTGKLRRNQLVLKGDRHYKESESLDQHPLTNPEHFTKAVIYEKRSKDKSDVEDDEFDNDDQKSCSQESLTTVSSNKTRRQQTHASSPSVGTVGSSLTAKTSDELNKTPVTKISKYKKHANTKYLIGCMVIVNRVVKKLASPSNEKLNKKNKSFVGLIVSPSSCDEENNPDIKTTQCIIKSFLDNCWYVSFKRDLEIIGKRDMLIKHKESDCATGAYIERCLLFFDAQIYPDLWDSAKLLYSPLYAAIDDNDRSLTKSISVSKKASSLTNSLSSLDSSSSEDEDQKSNKSNSSDQEYQNTKDEWVARFYGFWEDKGSPINQGLEIQGNEVDIYKLFELVKEFGGFQKANTSVRWPHIYHLLKLPHSSSENYQRLQILYKKFIYPYVDMKKKLGTFEQSRIRKQNEKPSAVSQKARPVLSARERREYVRQFIRKTTEARSASSQSVCERPTDHGISGDEIGTNSLIEEASQLSQCSSSPKLAFDRAIEGDSETKSNTTVAMNRLSPGTIISVAYGDKKVYKAKIIQQHSPDNKPLKSPSVDSKNTCKAPRMSLDSLSNADSASSVNNDFKSEIDNSTFYKVHYIGWNSRHDEIISPERILEVISDAGMDNQSTCSSSCRQKPTISDTEQPSEIVNNTLNDSCNLSAELIIDESIPIQSECEHIKEILITEDSVIETVETVIDIVEKLEEIVDCDNVDILIPKSVNFLKRRRSRSACFPELDINGFKKMPVLPESRTIDSLNLYKMGDKMPLPPKRLKYETVEANIQEFKEELKDEMKTSQFEYPIDSSSKRNSSDSNIGDTFSGKHHKDEYIPVGAESDDLKDYYKQDRIRSPSFSNDSVSGASTLSFRNEQDQSMFYLSPNEELDKSPPTPVKKIGNKRGRKPLLRPDKKMLISATTKIIRDHKSDIIEIESTSSQHSGSVHGRRVTRSIRTTEQNPVDDNSLHFEEDSQTSQDDSAFQLPTGVPLDIRSSSMVPLATGTPTLPSHKGRRPKSRRKNRNSLSTSSADGGYQDSNGESTAASVILANPEPQSLNQSTNIDNNNINFINNIHRPAGRSFQRLHPSLIPVGLENLPPEERVKLLEKVIRQTHLNFLDVKDKLKYVEKQILEIRAGRANGHCIESDEDKFR